jgi:hypothetical protein
MKYRDRRVGREPDPAKFYQPSPDTNISYPMDSNETKRTVFDCLKVNFIQLDNFPLKILSNKKLS